MRRFYGACRDLCDLWNGFLTAGSDRLSEGPLFLPPFALEIGYSLLLLDGVQCDDESALNTFSEEIRLEFE